MHHMTEKHQKKNKTKNHNYQGTVILYYVEQDYAVT